jgi:hypothetical protein
MRPPQLALEILALARTRRLRTRHVLIAVQWDYRHLSAAIAAAALLIRILAPPRSRRRSVPVALATSGLDRDRLAAGPRNRRTAAAGGRPSCVSVTGHACAHRGDGAGNARKGLRNYLYILSIYADSTFTSSSLKRSVIQAVKTPATLREHDVYAVPNPRIHRYTKLSWIPLSSIFRDPNPMLVRRLIVECIGIPHQCQRRTSC